MSTARSKPRRFSRQLNLLIVLLCVPLVALYAYDVLRRYAMAEQESERSVEALASDISIRVGMFLDQIQYISARVAAFPAVRESDRDRCDALLGDIKSLLRMTANVSVLSFDLRFICSARSVPDPPPEVIRHSAFDRAIDGRPSLSEPVRGALLGDWIVAAAHPVRDDAGRIVSVVTVTVNLRELAPLTDPGAVASGAFVTLVDEQGVIVAESADRYGQIGEPFARPELLASAAGSTVVETGTRQVYAVKTVNEQGWRVLAEMPQPGLLEGAYRDAGLQLALILGVIACFWIAATRVARGLIMSVNTLTAQVEGLTDGSGEVSIPETAPHELEALATSLNAALGAERELRARLESARRRLLEVEQAERRAIGRELHDRVGQNLVLLDLTLENLRRKAKDAGLNDMESAVVEARQVTRATAETIRDVMAELRPPGLDDYGLFAALEGLLTTYEQHSSTRLEMHGDSLEPRLPLEVETALFRIVQEAVNNVIKHAHAKHAEIRLEQDARSVVISVVDDGVGYDREAAADAAKTRPSWGLGTMQERADVVGARLSIDSAPGRGTRVTVVVDRPGP